MIDEKHQDGIAEVVEAYCNQHNILPKGKKIRLSIEVIPQRIVEVVVAHNHYNIAREFRPEILECKAIGSLESYVHENGVKGLPIRSIFNFLAEKYDIYTVRGVVLWEGDRSRNRPENEWYKVRHCGRKSFRIIEAWIHSLGLRLCMTEEELQELIDA